MTAYRLLNNFFTTIPKICEKPPLLRLKQSKPKANLIRRSELRRSHPIPLQPSLVWHKARPDEYAETGRTRRQSASPTPFHSRRRHEWQRFDVRHARKYLPRGWVARRPVYVAPPRRLRRTHPGQSPTHFRIRHPAHGRTNAPAP